MSDAPIIPSIDAGKFPGPLCNLPGSIQFSKGGKHTVPGGSGADLSFLLLPDGFCAHFFANVGNPRQLRFAPNGDLFVASPTRATTAGGQNGENAILVLFDHNHDGYADPPATYLSGLTATQGLLFANDSLYYQNGQSIVRVPYRPGDLSPSGRSTTVATVNYYVSSLHWPKPMDIADDGTIYVGNGGDQWTPTSGCITPHPFQGGILKLAGIAGDAGALPVARGFRNAIAIRCPRGHDKCFALELVQDYTDGVNGREKFGVIHDGDDWGFPCCATHNLLYANLGSAAPAAGNADCSGVFAETESFKVGHTPFGLDFEPSGKWPAPWSKAAFIALHGEAGSWTGTRVVSIPMDDTTGLPVPASDTTGSDVGMSDFATGWDDGTVSHGRPGSVTFSGDGRLFIANDANGDIFWVAPSGM